MDRDYAISIVQREAGRVLELGAASGGELAQPVPSCPDWDFAGLVSHLGNVYNWVGTIVEGRLPALPGPEMPRRAEAASALDWMDNRLGRLLTELREAPADALMWNFGPDSPSSVEFWCRRQLHETAIHRVDAELAAGVGVTALEADLAADTVCEVFSIFRFADVTDRDPDQTGSEAGVVQPGGVGPATIHLHATDLEGAEWTIDTAARTVARRHSKSDVAIRGTSWALARWCWGRPVSDEIEAFGDIEAAETWRSTVIR
jgi:uncharacterized protein (TIGR03083 family)